MDRWLKYGSFKEPEVNIPNKPVEIVESANVKVSNIEQESTSSFSEQQETSLSPCSVKTSVKIRKFNENYLSLGFTSTGSEEVPDAMCLLCNKILVNSSLVPTKLRRHFETNHPNCKDKDISFFKRKHEDYVNSKKFMIKKFKTDNDNATLASYKVSYRIALAGEPHVIGETLIKNCVKDIVSCMFNDEVAKKSDAVALSNNTVSRRIKDIATDIENELISRLKICDAYTLQLDESTDVAGLAILLVFVRYDFKRNIEEDLLLCESLKLNATGENIFNTINDYIKKHGLSWEKCIGVCSDGAKSMVGIISGAVTRIKNVAKNCISTHCILHKHALVTKNMSSTLKKVLDEAVKIINFIKSRALQSRIFTALCEDMGSVHTTLLLHTEVRWLSRGKILVRLFELRQELLVYFVEHKFELSDRLSNTSWLLRIAYLADIFAKLNESCVKLQHKAVNIFEAKDTILSLSRKLEYWISAVEQNTFDCFPTLSDFLREHKLNLDTEIRNDIRSHLYGLLESRDKYFPDMRNDDNNVSWIQDPFRVKEKLKEFSPEEYESFIEIRSNSYLKAKFEETSITQFWSNIYQEYPKLSKKAIRFLLPFATTYLCEAGFSKYAHTKSKYRNKLNAAPDMRIQLSNIEPNFDRILEFRTQTHSSH